MKGKNSEDRGHADSNHRLVCANCGNHDRFIEVMAEEAHIVNGNFDYIELLEGIVDHYICWECGISFELEAKA